VLFIASIAGWRRRKKQRKQKGRRAHFKLKVPRCFPFPPLKKEAKVKFVNDIKAS